MGIIKSLKCTVCGVSYEQSDELLTCTQCGRDGILDVIYDYDDAVRLLTKSNLTSNPELSHWRYRPLLPVSDDMELPPLRVGWSPLYRSERLASYVNINELYLKDDGQNPTNSLKDRASSVGVARAMHARANGITCASTGNAATSLAGNAASVGLRSFIFVPKRIPPAKLAQLLVFDAVVFVVQGSYEDAFELSMKSAEYFKWYNRNSAINPYLIEGKKTAAFEALEQLKWQTPDVIALSVGDGCSIAGFWKGLKELNELGLIDRLPRLIGVQANGAAPIAAAWQQGDESIQTLVPHTLADSIAVGTPRNWRKALRAVRESNGLYITVSDDEILQAMRITGSQTGIFGEPAGITSVAGLIAARNKGYFSSKITALAVITGNGLKDTDSAIKSCEGKAYNIEPAFGYVRNIVEKLV